MTQVPDDFLPIKKTKMWQSKENLKKDKDWKPLLPHFCPALDPETEKKCGKFMGHWDIYFYQQYGMCEQCYLKYNDGKGIKVTTEMENSNDDGNA
tara:strand:+ start:676 stop:960 length:285 start_codon:yes stop_codon:yes gene_type:complete